jgi:hypothetical protein
MNISELVNHSIGSSDQSISRSGGFEHVLMQFEPDEEYAMYVI